MRTTKKQKRARKTRKLNDFLYSKMLYPNFKFQHPMSILVVGPTITGKTYFVDHLLSTLNEKMSFKNPNLKCRINCLMDSGNNIILICKSNSKKYISVLCKVYLNIVKLLKILMFDTTMF